MAKTKALPVSHAYTSPATETTCVSAHVEVLVAMHSSEARDCSVTLLHAENMPSYNTVLQLSDEKIWKRVSIARPKLLKFALGLGSVSPKRDMPMTANTIIVVKMKRMRLKTALALCAILTSIRKRGRRKKYLHARIRRRMARERRRAVFSCRAPADWAISADVVKSCTRKSKLCSGCLKYFAREPSHATCRMNSTRKKMEK
mmetsp:Transcript_7220/g.18429  ORF Transcript_7220/g.18429 Transcript_7220/m.18429 type:complete len:202 (-) Transcript_7220:171-776(-)